MMWTPLRSPKMYGFIFGFQRWVWWPKCAPASSNCCIVTTVVAIGLLLPVLPRRTCHRPCEPAPVCWSVCGMGGQLAEAAPVFKGLTGAEHALLTRENKKGTTI